ncbi:MAG: hypothetical protein ABMA26_16185 [Limisphaerales bacterium]
MNTALEGLIQALNAWHEAGEDTEGRRESVYHSLLEDFTALHPGTNLAALDRYVRQAHLRWLRAQQKPAALPPKA